MAKEVIHDIGEKIGGARKDLYGSTELQEWFDRQGDRSDGNSAPVKGGNVWQVAEPDCGLDPARIAWINGLNGYLKSSRDESKALRRTLQPIVPVLKAVLWSEDSHIGDPLELIEGVASTLFEADAQSLLGDVTVAPFASRNEFVSDGRPVTDPADILKARIGMFCDTLLNQAVDQGFIEPESPDVADGLYANQGEGFVGRLKPVLELAFGHVVERAVFGPGFRPGKYRAGIRVGDNGHTVMSVVLGRVGKGRYQEQSAFRAKKSYEISTSDIGLLRSREEPLFEALPGIADARSVNEKARESREPDQRDKLDKFYKRLRATSIWVDGKRVWKLGVAMRGRPFLQLGPNFEYRGRRPHREMWDWIPENLNGLYEEFQTLVQGADKKFRILNHTPRAGPDLERPNLEDSGESIRVKFGLRAIEWGNHVPQKERVVQLRRFHDAMMDLANVMGVEPSFLGLDQRLAVAFGSRGRGGMNAARAHFEVDRNVINLTRRSGGGCLAHEWFHAFDFMSRMNDRPHFSHLTRSFAHRAEILDALRASQSGRKRYYSLPEELDARAFEDLIGRRLSALGQRNDYLVDRVVEKDWEIGSKYYPYPLADEAELFDQRLDLILGREPVDRDISNQCLDSNEALALWASDRPVVAEDGRGNGEVSHDNPPTSCIERFGGSKVPDSKAHDGQLDLGI